MAHAWRDLLMLRTLSEIATINVAQAAGLQRRLSRRRFETLSIEQSRNMMFDLCEASSGNRAVTKGSGLDLPQPPHVAHQLDFFRRILLAKFRAVDTGAPLRRTQTA
jgi:hypothetical protein